MPSPIPDSAPDPARDPATGRQVRSWLDAWRRSFSEGPGDWTGLFEASRADPDLVESTLDAWLAAELNLVEPEADAIPWFDLLVTRWRGTERAAFDGDGLQCSYDDLDRITAARAAAWRSAGVTPGTTVCVCRTFGFEALIDLLTAFRLGACVAWVPTYGEPYERAALLACQADHVALEPAALRRLSDLGQALLPSHEQRVHEHRAKDAVAASYERQAACLTVLSPTATAAEGDAPSWQWTPLSCATLLRAAARDAVLVWRLRPGDVLGAPGFEGPRHQPALLLACLLAGGCYVHRTLEQVETDPSCLARSWRTVGLRAAAAAPWLASFAAGTSADVCFRDLEEAWEIPLWNRFQKVLGPTTEATLVLLEPSVGGVALTSVPCDDRSEGAVRVLPGTRSGIIPLEGAPPSSSLGTLQLEAAGAAPPYVLLASLGGERYRYLGTQRPRRAGCVFPRDVSIEAVRRLPGVLAASVVALPTGGERGGACFGLVVFVHSPSRWDDERAARVQRCVEGFLGEVLAPEIRPDFVECHPLLPLEDADGTVDVGWVTEQRLRGSLKKKSRLSVFRRLTALRAGEV